MKISRLLPLAVASLFFIGAGCETVATAPAASTSSPAADTVSSQPAVGSENCRISGLVKDVESGRPIPNAAVNVMHSSLWTKAGFGGRFCLDAPPGTYTLTAAGDFYKESSQVDADVREQPVQNIELTLAPQKTLDRVYVEPEVQYLPGTSGLKVTVIDSQIGKGVPGIAVVTAYAGVPGGQNRVTGADGSFLDTSIGEWPNTYKLFLSNRDGVPEAKNLVKKVAKNEYQVHIVSGYVTELEIRL